MEIDSNSRKCQSLAYENARNLWHLVTLQSLAVLYYFTSQKVTAVVTAVLIIPVAAFEITRLRHRKLNGVFTNYFSIILRPEETTKVAAHVYALLSCLAVILLFKKSTAIMSITFFAFGDVTASLALQARPNVEGYGKYTLAGAGCFLGCIVVGVVLGYTKVGLGLHVIVAGSLAAGIAEILPISLDDNCTMPVFAALAMTVLRLR